VIERDVRAQAERFGLSPDHVLDLVEVSPVMKPGPFGVDEATRDAIARQMRTLALTRPEVVRDPSALKLAPREAWDHMQGLLAAGQRVEAEAFQRAHADAVEVGKRAATRDMARTIEDRGARETRVQNRAEKRLALEHYNAEDKQWLEHGERTGHFPGGPRADRADPSAHRGAQPEAGRPPGRRGCGRVRTWPRDARAVGCGANTEARLCPRIPLARDPRGGWSGRIAGQHYQW
jgi:hypothetical protein